MILRSLAALALFGLTLPLAPMTNAQTTNACQSAASDADGDGFGWENGQSCRVTDRSIDTPEYINLQTGQPVDLFRAYWNAEDFYKQIVCLDHYFDGSDYVSYSDLLLEPERLPLIAPFQSRVNISRRRISDTTSVIWGLENGIFMGPTPLGLSPWLETVDITNADGSFASQEVRVWTSNFSYTSCRTPNPNDRFVPTGSPSPIVDVFNGECIDTTPAGDGWGWNGTESCRVVSENACIDTDPVGDGWGWDGVTSCRI